MNNNYWMKSGPLRCGFNTPAALSGDATFGLPPFDMRPSYLVDEYPACPEAWMRSEGTLASYFTGVQEGRGIWLDFRDTLTHTPMHAAFVISVQGVNAITGLPCNDPHLEQYLESCPKHDIKFGPERFCSKCNYRWPKQNYLASTATHRDTLWLDGFRAADGVVRQYIATAKKERGVANAIIGEKRVFAIGISLFLSKTPRPAPPVMRRLLDIGMPVMDDYVHVGYDSKTDWDGGDMLNFKSTSKLYADKSVQSYCCNSIELSAKLSNQTLHSSGPVRLSANATSALRSISVKSLEIAAGAKINQAIADDPYDLSFWLDKPESILVINYCLESEVNDILKAGKLDLVGSEEGFLTNIPKGN